MRRKTDRIICICKTCQISFFLLYRTFLHKLSRTMIALFFESLIKTIRNHFTTVLQKIIINKKLFYICTCFTITERIYTCVRTLHLFTQKKTLTIKLETNGVSTIIILRNKINSIFSRYTHWLHSLDRHFLPITSYSFWQI